MRWIRRLTLLGLLGGGAGWMWRSRRAPGTSGSAPEWPPAATGTPSTPATSATSGRAEAVSANGTAAGSGHGFNPLGDTGSRRDDTSSHGKSVSEGAATAHGFASVGSTPPGASAAPVASAIEGSATWAEPVDGRCPEGFPIKGNASSRIYHVPGGRSYDRTIPERCYATPEAAAADGFRPAKA